MAMPFSKVEVDQWNLSKCHWDEGCVHAIGRLGGLRSGWEVRRKTREGNYFKMFGSEGSREGEGQWRVWFGT